MTGNRGWPTICTDPPMRSSISSSRPVAVKPARGPCEFHHEALLRTALQPQTTVGVEVRHDDLVAHDVHDVGVVPHALRRERAAAHGHAVDAVVRQAIEPDQRTLIVVHAGHDIDRCRWCDRHRSSASQFRALTLMLITAPALLISVLETMIGWAPRTKMVDESFGPRPSRLVGACPPSPSALNSNLLLAIRTSD